jgi:hypothetical protein
MHVAEAEMMTRKLTRSAAANPAPAAPQSRVASASTTASVSAAGAVPALHTGGVYHGFVTSSLLPGQVFPGTWTVNSDGSVDSVNTYGDRSHGTMISSDPDNIVGTAISHLGVQGGVQRRYPDGSTSTQVTS